MNSETSNIVYFDLETQKSFHDVGGGSNKKDMRVSVAVTYSTKDNQYRIYSEDHIGDLILQLAEADLVVGYNHLNFDYAVLQPYDLDINTFEKLPGTKNRDMLVDIEAILGYRIKLESVAQGTLNFGKTAQGLDSLRWWQEYKKTSDPQYVMKIAEYCAFDVKVTKLVHEYGLQHGHVRYIDKLGMVRELKIGNPGEWGEAADYAQYLPKQ